MAGSWIGSQFVGDDSNDDATGTSAAESLFGNKGDDVLRGAGGIDYVDGGVGNDNLFGGDGNDIVVDVGSIPFGFVGIIGRDRLYGGDGDDEMRMNSADTGDFVFGGEGRDLLRLNFLALNPNPLPPGTPIVFQLGADGSGVVKVNDINTVAVMGIEYIYFRAFNGNDVIGGGDDNDAIWGEGGEDFLYGRGGDDDLDGGTGIQHLFGGDGFDTASFDIAEFGADQTIVNAANVSLGAAGEVKGFEAYDYISTGIGHDLFNLTQSTSVSINSGSGNDTVRVGDGGSELFGSAGDDVFDTGSGYDEVDGGDGNNTAHLGGGGDQYYHDNTRNYTGSERIWGEDGDDDIYTGAGTDSTYGGAGNDLIYNGQGNDVSYGGDGNDRFFGETGQDRIYGGLGNDVIDTDIDPWLDFLTQETDRAWGGDGDDTVTGGCGSDSLYGEDGNDVVSIYLYAEGGVLDGMADKLFGGLGTDRLWIVGAGSGNPDLVEIRFDPVLTKVMVNGTVHAFARDFEALTVSAYGANGQIITGGDGDNSVYTGPGDDTIRTGGGNDFVNSGTGSDDITTGDGNDLVSTTYLDGTDNILTGAGDDEVVLAGSYTSQGVALGGGIINGGAGNDLLRLYFSDRPMQVIGNQIWVGGVHAADFLGFERVIFSGSANADVLAGTAGADVLSGQGGDNSLDGLGGSDTIDGGIGNDTVVGGDGDNSLIGGSNDDSVFGGAGNDTVNAASGADAVFGGSGDDRVVLTVDALADALHGGGNTDTLQVFTFLTGQVVMTGPLAGGGTLSRDGVAIASYDGFEAISINSSSGDDSVLGGSGNDTISVATGANTVRSGGGDDQVTITADSPADLVDLGGGGGDHIMMFNAGVAGDMVFTLGAVTQLTAGGVVLADILGAERVTLYTNAGNDTATGGVLADAFFGGQGRDDFFGGDGDDSFQISVDAPRDDVFGGAGTDVLTVFGGATAIVTDHSTPGRVLIKTGGATVVDARSVEALRLFGSFDTVTGDDLAGLSGADLLSGSGGDDTLRGAGGADTVQGGAGLDLLAGGAGGDTFAFYGIAEGADLVEDFAGGDFIQVSRFGFVGLVAGGPVVLVSGTDPAAAAAGGQFLFDTDDGRLLWDADGAGAGVAVLIATLENGGGAAGLTAGQFLVI